jgi:bifunctional non-homologous end joining protein LigD
VSYEDGRLVYIGNAGGGFTEEALAEMYERLKPLVMKTSPFARPPATPAPVTWVTPALVCEVRFAEWTDEGLMRQPYSLVCGRTWNPADVTREEPETAPGTGPPTGRRPGMRREAVGRRRARSWSSTTRGSR